MAFMAHNLAPASAQTTRNFVIGTKDIGASPVVRTVRATADGIVKEASFTINPIWERLPEPFRIASGITLPPGTEYDYTRYSFRVQTANRRMASSAASESSPP